MLETLFGSEPDVFLQEHWPLSMTHFHGPLDRFAWLEGRPELANTEALLTHLAGTEGRALLYFGDRKDEHSAFEMAASDIASFYGAASMFSAGSSGLNLLGLDAQLHALRDELGLSKLSKCRNIVYGSKPGPGAVWHWDAGANIVVQLKGVKRWRVAPNTVVANPSDRYAVTMSAPSPRLQSALAPDACLEPPSDYETIDLRPGSVLFLPRGYWHTTETIEESLALNFTFGLPDHVQVLTRYLAATLRTDERWRALAQPQHSTAAFADLLTELAAELATIDAEDLLASC